MQTPMQPSKNRTAEHSPFSFPSPVAMPSDIRFRTRILTLTVAVIATLDVFSGPFVRFLDTVLFNTTLERLAFGCFFLHRRP